MEYGKWGTSYTSIHPNSEERALYTLINLARMHPDDYIVSSYGIKKYGTFGATATYYNGTDSTYCGVASTVPYYWISSINQAARFASWDCKNCSDGICGSIPNYNTCTDPDRCTSLFGGDCGYAARCDAFLQEDQNIYGNGFTCAAEGICGANLCYTESGDQCDDIFNPFREILGIGFEPGTNGYTLDYGSGYNASISELYNYSIVSVSHFDERIKIDYDYYNSEEKYLTFMLQWFDKNIEAFNVSVVYNGSMNSMSLDYGNRNNGFWLAHDTVKLK